MLSVARIKSRTNMSYFNTFRDFFASGGKRATQEWIRLQLFRRQDQRESAHDGDDVPPNTPRLKTQNIRFALLYRSIRSLKYWGRSWNARFPGWRGSIAGFSILAAVVLIANFSALIWAAMNLDAGSYYATMTKKNCKAVEETSAWVHLSMNVLSAALLAGSNYCMQCLTSPTRKEVDAAHTNGSYLNIGILSFRNIVPFRKRRICLLVALGLSSLPLHAVYASSVSTRLSSQVYDIVVVSPEFFSGGRFTLSDNNYDIYSSIIDRQHVKSRLGILQESTLNGQIWNESRWTNLSVTECKEYGGFDTDHGSILLVTEEESDRASTVLEWGLNSGTSPKNVEIISSRHHISYCLSLAGSSQCYLQIHLWLLLTVVVCNIIKIACFMLTFNEQRGIPLVTVGDAVASFLSLPCPRVYGMCLLQKDELIGEITRDSEVSSDETGPLPKQYKATPLRFYQSISFIRWIIYSTSCALVILASSYLWNDILIKYRGDRTDYSLHALWKMGFGKLRENSRGYMSAPWCFLAAFRHTDGCLPLEFGYNFIVAIPQVLVSATYIALNYQITVMIQLRDWTSLARHRQPLRVSHPGPSSAQVSTYWLSLPYRCSLPLFISSTFLSWLTSKALFYYRLVYYDSDGSPWRELGDPDLTSPRVYHGLGYSAVAVISSILVGVCVFLLSLALGTQQCTPGLPLGPTNSLVIAAACHPPEDDRNAAINLVQWGEVQSDNDTEERNAVRHCTITSRKVKSPEEGRWYA